MFGGTVKLQDEVDETADLAALVRREIKALSEEPKEVEPSRRAGMASEAPEADASAEEIEATSTSEKLADVDPLSVLGSARTAVAESIVDLYTTIEAAEPARLSLMVARL